MTSPRLQALVPLVAGLPLLVILPLTGVWLAGYPVGQYLEFPPLTQYVEHAGFSWPAFIALALAIAAFTGPFIWRNVKAARGFRVQGSGLDDVPVGSREQESAPHPPPIFNLQSSIFSFQFPLWGWFGLVLVLVAWFLAWTRFTWFAPLQDFTFSPLWFGYILVVSALTVRRTGHCLMTDRPLAFALLFPLSAGFWWFFEFLNRFVQNWYYVGIGTLTPLEYVIFATLPFSTVLPAVLGTEELLRSFPVIGRGLTPVAHAPHRHASAGRRAVAIGTLTVAALSLAGIGVWPDWLFPLLWLSPLLVMTSLQALAGQPTIFAPAAQGDWNRLYRLALASLVCGFFWELWNYGSLARWIYTVPFVNRFHLFEMPILGYAGYLPFGLECAVAAEIVFGRTQDRSPIINHSPINHPSPTIPH